METKLNLDFILKELANDNEASLEPLFNHYYPRLYNFSKSFLKLEDGIDDVLQEVFVKIWQHRKNITDSTSFNSLIFTITKNLLLNELRSRLKKEKLSEEIKILSTASEYSSYNNVEYEDLKEKVDEIIKELPSRSQEIFVLSRKNGLSHKEISEKMGISTKTIEYHITQSTRILKEKLKEFGLLSVLWFYLFL